MKDAFVVAAIIGACMSSAFALAACPMHLPEAPTPVATPDSSCAVDDAVTAARLIRTPGGAPLVVHCDAGAE